MGHGCHGDRGGSCIEWDQATMCVTESEHCKAIEFLLFLVENKDGRIKQDIVLMTSHKEKGCTGRTYQSFCQHRINTNFFSDLYQKKVKMLAHLIYQMHLCKQNGPHRQTWGSHHHEDQSCHSWHTLWIRQCLQWHYYLVKQRTR